MRFREWLQNIFHFNKQERNGVFILCMIISLLFFIRFALPYFTGNTSKVEFISVSLPENTTEAKETAPVSNEFISNNRAQNEERIRSMFVFNPNIISAEDALKLGFSDKLSHTLINFRNKGGKFFKPDDLKKLYGLSATLFDELEPYILIPHSVKEFENKPKNDSIYKSHFPKTSYEKKVFIKEMVELNTADSLKIVYLKGIGPAFTKRIIKYRTMLGGFHSIQQLKEIYGMSDSLFLSLSSQITLNKNAITKISINSIDATTLRKHPYFSNGSAQALINFRIKHGKLLEQDIISMGIFNEDKLKLILPYLVY